MQRYKYIIIGGGICGCSVAYELAKTTQDILLIEKNKDVAGGASGAAGAFLSPLLGKPNSFKDLVTTSLKYATTFYTQEFSSFIQNCGTLRIPKDEKDKQKFQSYKPYMEFAYEKKGDGYYFDIGSVVQSYNICKQMVKKINTKFNYGVDYIRFDGNSWIINNDFSCENLILATGYENSLLQESYIKIRAVWGRRIDITSITKTTTNYHKECSISKSNLQKDGLEHLSIGATHHRDKKGVEDRDKNHKELLKKAADIIDLKDITIVKDYVGARACSVDYFPMIGAVVDSKKTVEEFPYMVYGTHVKSERFTRYQNLYIINGVGGRGFVLAPFLAQELVAYLTKKKKIDQNLTVDRFFKRAVKKQQVG